MQLALLVLLACGSPEPTPVAAPIVAAPRPPPALSELEREALTNRVLAPSPVETMKTMERAGIGSDLAVLVPRRKLTVDGPNVDVAALRTGVVLADTVLILKDVSDEDLGLRMQSVLVGLRRIGAGAGLLANVSGVIDRHANGGITRDEILDALDETVSSAVPGSGVGPEDRTGPLLQAGAWLATTNVAAEAVLRSGKYDSAALLFHQRPVVDWFHGYVQGAAKAKADEQVLKLLDETLAELSVTAAKDTFAEADVRRIRDRTAALLEMM